MKKILIVVAPIDFRDEELLDPKNIFEKNGFSIEIASKNTKIAKGMLGGEISVDRDISKVDAKDYDAVIFVGGTGSSIYFNDQHALNLAKRASGLGKIIGAICIAPSILANAGLLSGKTATSFPSEKDNLIKHGAKYSGENVSVDGKIVTANGPKSAKLFGQKISELLMEQ